ncbi:MAG: hypothetical protein ACI4SR_10295 [Faecalibacillus sp.]
MRTKLKRITFVFMALLLLSIGNVFAATKSTIYAYNNVSGVSATVYVKPTATISGSTCTSASISGYTSNSTQYPKVSVSVSSKSLNGSNYYCKISGTAQVYNYNQTYIAGYIKDTWTVSK